MGAVQPLQLQQQGEWMQKEWAAVGQLLAESI
jgi:hypothetical protein